MAAPPHIPHLIYMKTFMVCIREPHGRGSQHFRTGVIVAPNRDAAIGYALVQGRAAKDAVVDCEEVQPETLLIIKSGMGRAGRSAL